MNDILDALSARIKSPYFGYSVLAFLGLNWRGIFLLFSLNGTAYERIHAFDLETSIYSLLLFPLLVGTAVALSSPWIRFFFAYFSRIPLELADNVSLNLEHRKAIRQAELERTRSDLFAVKEDELIERAKRDEKIAEIDNQEVQAKLNAQIEELRKERDQLSEQVKSQGSTLKSSKNLSRAASEILRAASLSSEGEITMIGTLAGTTIDVGEEQFGGHNSREFARYESGLQELIDFGYVKDRSGKGERFVLTHDGWNTAEIL